jgi:hypothetical protein
MRLSSAAADVGDQAPDPTVFLRLWKKGGGQVPEGPVHVSMNDFLIHKWVDVPRVALAGFRFRRAWPRTQGALGLWFAWTPTGRRQISISVWRAPEDPWTADQFDRSMIWRQAEDRLRGRIAGIPHH